MTNEEIAEHEREILHRNRMECLCVAEALTELKEVRDLYASGKKDEAFDWLVFFVAGIARRPQNLMMHATGGFVGTEEVDRDGNLNEDKVAERGQQRLVMEGFGLRAKAAHFGPPQIVKT